MNPSEQLEACSLCGKLSATVNHQLAAKGA
ncbi:unannotated protein [freshwater metagenome]|uniref:Unannotated protein n=1 Tax=freshwater metagenome TaxID=449393 RepID=A0A6J7EVL6_9ZZZZ